MPSMKRRIGPVWRAAEINLTHYGVQVSATISSEVTLIRSPAAVSDNDKLDIVAYVLQRNNFPAGTADLTDAPRLATLQIMPKDGPSPPRTGSMVEATGCLEGEGSEWKLTNATPPRIASSSAPASGQQAADESATGGVTVPLISVFPRPTAHVGHKMRAKGLFVKTATLERINVTSLEMVAESCTP